MHRNSPNHFPFYTFRTLNFCSTTLLNLFPTSPGTVIEQNISILHHCYRVVIFLLIIILYIYISLLPIISSKCQFLLSKFNTSSALYCFHSPSPPRINLNGRRMFPNIILSFNLLSYAIVLSWLRFRCFCCLFSINVWGYICHMNTYTHV